MYERISLALIDNPLFLLIPVGIIGLWRWGVWLIRRLIGLRYRAQTPEALAATASIITPVYNENTTLFRNALESWAQENPLEIIAVIDHSDTACIETFKEFAKTFDGARLIVTPKPGKRAALADGIAAATGDIVVLVDSDTIWDQGVLAKVVTPFKDPRVGGVGTRQNVLKPQTLAQRLFDIHLDSRYFDEIRFLAAAGDAVTCLSGRTAAYRRSAVLPLLNDLVNETFFGKPVISGDDKRLTHLVQAAGWRVRYQENARVFTPGSPKMRSFLKQRLRWTRNSWRADLRAMYEGWVWKKPALAFHLLDRLFQPVTTLIAPTYFLIALYRQNWRIVLLLLAWWLVSRTVKILPHIRRQPAGVVMVPAYIFFSYVFALFKLFAFFTMNEQGWITRWDSSRLERVRRIRLAPAYGATLSVVLILAVSMFRVDAVQHERVYKSKFFQIESDLPGYDLEQVSVHLSLQRPPQVEVGASGVATGYISYRVGAGDTPELLGRKYGFDPDKIVHPSAIWEPGERLYIPLPFKDYKAYRKGIVVGEVPAEVFYVPESNTIVISGYGAAIDIPTLHKMMDKDAIIEYEGEGVYFLKANIFLERHTLLVMEAPEMSWLKMKSDADGHVAISSVGGGIWVDGIKVSSWDAIANDYDKVYEDGRSFLLIRNARMDIVNAEVGYLGYSLETSGGDGGVYGLSWRITDEERFGRELTTGYLENSRVHHNYFGMYSFGATGMVIRNNEVFASDQYGLDPHDDSNNFIVEHNYIHDNGNHGIIFSKRCFNNVIRWNRSENNVLHGIMLDRRSNNNSVYENVLVGNKDGVALWDSHNNDIYNNEIIASQRGVRLNRLSSYNVIRDNQVIDSTQYGLYIYDEAHNNVFRKNSMQNNEIGVYIRSTDNFIFDNRIAGSDRGINLTDESGANKIFQNRLEHNTLAMYLKTRPDDYVIDNIFVENEENIQITPLWRSVPPDWLAARPERVTPRMTVATNSWLTQLPAPKAVTIASGPAWIMDNSASVLNDQEMADNSEVTDNPDWAESNRAKPAPSFEPTAAATITATGPIPGPKPTVTSPVTPTVAPEVVTPPTPTPPLAPAIESEWLRYLNQFRSEANLPLLVENSQLSEGSRLHSIYMVKTNSVQHDENSRSSWYTEAGRLAAENGTIFADPWEGVSAEFMINYWLSTPFSLVPIIDPELHAVGFGMYREASGRVRVAGTLDLTQGLGDLPATVTYPLPFPRDGGQTWILGATLDESPSPLSNCSGYRRVTGPPIVLQIGVGDRTPNVTEHTFRQGETLLDHCMFDETTYINPEPFLQERGRLILDQRDAIVLIPRKPLESGKTYTVTIVESGVPFTWSFAAISPPE